MTRCLAPLMAATLALSACGPPQPEIPAPRRIVLVTIDTLRGDHVSAYGYPLAITPFFDRLAADSVRFARTYSHSATTKPSHSSMFTSLYPMQHGVQNNGLVLDGEFQTLAEMLASSGYRTAGFVSTDAPLGGNVNQGFDTWDQFVADPDEQNFRSQYRPAAETVDRAIEWLGSVTADDPFFLWVHVYDPHRPLQPPAEYRQRVEAMLAEYGDEPFRQWMETRGIPLRRDRNYEDALDYAAEILYADAQIGRLYETMQGAGLDDGALWIITADHGQGLGAHDWFGHSKQIYQAQIAVPLLIHYEGLAPAVVADRIVEHVDLLPTLAELTGLTPSQILPIQGKSLVPLLRGERRMDAKWFAFAERSRYVDASADRQERGNYEPGSRYSLQDLEYKYLLFTDGDDEFYDLRTDPDELVNLIDDPQYADRRQQMLDALLQLIQALPSDRQAQTVTPEEIERLRALGYIQ